MSSFTMPSTSQADRKQQQEQAENAQFFSAEQRQRMSGPRRDIRRFGQPVHQDNLGSEQDVEQLTSSMRASTLNPIAQDFQPGSAFGQQPYAWDVAQVPYAQASDIHPTPTANHRPSPAISLYTAADQATQPPFTTAGNAYPAAPTHITTYDGVQQPFTSLYQVPQPQVLYSPAGAYYTYSAVDWYSQWVDQLHTSLDAAIATYNNMVRHYHQVGLQYHSIPIRFRADRPTPGVARNFEAAFIFTHDEYQMRPGRRMKMIHGFGLAGYSIRVAFEALQRGDLQVAARGLNVEIVQDLGALARAVQMLEASIGDVVQAADRVGRSWLRKVRRRDEGWQEEEMRKEEMAVEARAKQAQWETALLEAGRYVRWVEEQMEAEEEMYDEEVDLEETYDEEMYAGEMDAEVTAMRTPGTKRKRKGRGKGKGKGKARPVEQTAGPFVLDEQGEPIKGHAVYQLRKSIRKRERKEQEQRERLEALAASESYREVEDASEAVDNSAV